MNVILLHCHYRRGGVTQVVENQVAGLRDTIDGKLVLASDGNLSGVSEATLDRTQQWTIDALGYDVSDEGPRRLQNAQAIETELIRQINGAGLHADETVLHWHNHSLGKNAAIPEVIRRLAERGFRQLLQIHDFAEDYRPENYAHLIDALHVTSPAEFSSACYPDSPAVHYATLTRADGVVLQSLGIADRRVHFLPNSVTLGERELPTSEDALRRVRKSFELPSDALWGLYPIRGIRRKNVGEFCLLSQLLPDPFYLGITLEPTTEIELASYQRWRSIAVDVAPRAVFDAGMHDDVAFLDNLSASRFIVSTSVAEGFGMAFLEPWLAGRGVVGRRLPGVVEDFEAAGLNLDRFYQRLNIPASPEWIAEAEREWDAAFHQAWQAVPTAFRPQVTRRQQPDDDALGFDFAKLLPGRQAQVLRQMHHDSGFVDAVKEANAGLLESLQQPFDPDTVDANAAIVRDEYSVGKAAERLASIYHRILSDESSDTLSKSTGHGVDASVNLICAERDFFPCRTETSIQR